MNWLDRFHVAAAAFGSAYGAAWDLATSPFDNDDESFSEVVGKLGQATIGTLNGIGQLGVGIGAGALWGADKLSENLVLEPLSTVVTAASLADAPSWQSGILSGNTWSKAHEIAQYRSFGQSVYAAFATSDVIAQEQEIEKAKDSFLFNAVTGTIDAGANVLLDPTAVVGKVYSAGKAVEKGFGAGYRASDPILQRLIAKKTSIGVGDIDPYDYAQSKAVSDFIKWTDGKTGRQIANHEAVRKSAYPTVLAGLFQEADPATKRLIVAVAYGDNKKALSELAARRDDLAMRVARADNATNFALQHEFSRGWRSSMPVPRIRPLAKDKQPDPEQIPLFDAGAFPLGKEGPGGKEAKPKAGGPSVVPVRPGQNNGPGLPDYQYQSISGNITKTVPGRYVLAPKTNVTGAGGISVEGGPYSMLGPVNPESIKELIPYLNGDAKARAAQDWEQLAIPGLPPKEAWKAATNWEQHNKTMGQFGDSTIPKPGPFDPLDWDEDLSARLMPWDRQATKWFMSYQRELAQKSRKELDLISAAVGVGGEGRGVWNSMIGQVISSSKQLRDADKTLAYDWESRSGVDDQIVMPKAFGLGVRVIKSMPFSVARSFTEKRPPSWIDPNRGDSHAGFAAYLNSINEFDARTKDAVLRQYMRTFDAGGKREIIARIEASAIKAMAMRYGLSTEAADQIARQSVGQRNSVITQLRKKKEQNYAADVVPTKAAFPWDDFPVDDDLIPVTSPLFETQEINSIPLLDLDKYDRAFRQHAETLNAFDRGSAGVSDFMDKAYDVLNPLWSFSVLMRFGYTIRTLTDDMLRIWASLGAMSIMGNISAGAKNMLTEDGRNWDTFAPSKGALGQRAKNAKVRTQMLAASAQGAIHTRGRDDMRDVAKSISGYVDEMGRDIGSVRTIGDIGFRHGDAWFDGPYSGRGSSYRQIVGGSYDAIARTTGEVIERLRSDYASWDVVNPDDPGHLDAWLYAVNSQIAKSALGHKFLTGETGQSVERWLRTTPEGQSVRKRVGTYGKDPQRLAGMAQATVDAYVPLLRDSDNPFMLRQLARSGELTTKHLADAFPDVMSRPQVHGPTIDDNLHQGAFHQFRESIVSTGFKWLSQLPSDKLMRHPTFRTLYKDSIRTQYDNLTRNLARDAKPFSEILKSENPKKELLKERKRLLVTGDDVIAMEHAARETALRGVNDLLYDVSTKSNAAHFFRFVTSFFSAWEDSITKWGRLAMEKPQLLFYGSKIWEAPNEMNLGSTTDEHGNLVPRVQVTDDQGHRIASRNVNGEQQWGYWDVDKKWVRKEPAIDDGTKIVARLPAWVKKVIPGAEEFGSVQIPKSSLNLILQGDPWWLPGAGPLIQVPLSTIAAKQPTIKNVYEWAIPFGQQSMTDVLLPGWIKQAIKSGNGLNDPAYANIYTQIMQTEEMRVRMHQRTRPSPIQFEKEIAQRADAAFKIRSFTRFFAPFTADLQSPYQFYIDQYRQMQEIYGKDADERFYGTYGDSLYIFATALSKNNIGAMATDSAWKATEKYKDLIAANPEFGGLIIGPDANKGGFNQYVHSAQFGQTLSPGSNMTVREKRSPVEALAANDASAGWMQFQKYMGVVTTLSSKLSDDQLAVARKFVVDYVGQRHASWLADYMESDRSALPNRIAFMEKLVTDPQMMNNPLRTDLHTLQQYLTARQGFIAYLADLKRQGLPHTLEARDNAGIARRWAEVQMSLEESDTRFGDLFWRYLSNDKLQVA